jgi:transposase
MDKYIGLDVSDKQTVACVIAKGRKDVYATVPTELPALRAFLAQQRQAGDRLHATFEVSGQAGWLYDGLRDTVDHLAVSNPSQMTWIYRTTKKTDRVDARKQAVLLQMGELPTVHMPPRAVRQWRGEIQHRRKLIERACQVKNRIRAHLKGAGICRPVTRMGWWTQKCRGWMAEVLPGDLALSDLLEELALLERQIKRATALLDVRLENTAADLLMTIPGVGPRTAEAVLAYTDEVSRFRRGKEFCAYFGLTPKLDESGRVRRVGHISKQGPSVARWLLVECAWRAVAKSPALGQFYERVRHGQPQRKKIAIVAVARKLLSIMRAMLTTGEIFNEALVLRQEVRSSGRAAGRPGRRSGTARRGRRRP